jgi:outer membrane protein
MTRHRKTSALVWGALIGLLALFGAAPQASADLKIGFIDSDQIFANYSKTKEAQASFEREVADLSKTAREKKNEIDEMQRKLDQQGPMLSEAKRDEQNRILSQKVGEYEKFVQEQWGPGGRISRLNEEYLKPIIDRVHAIVASIGTEEGYSLILDAADGNVVYGDKSLDLTDRVLSELRTEDETGTRSGGKKP